jgi:hypothetical protein
MEYDFAIFPFSLLGLNHSARDKVFGGKVRNLKTRKMQDHLK